MTNSPIAGLAVPSPTESGWPSDDAGPEAGRPALLH
jgi:hypothetical protein